MVDELYSFEPKMFCPAQDRPNFPATYTTHYASTSVILEAELVFGGKFNKLTHYNMARILGTSDSHVRSWIRQQYRPSQLYLARLCKVYAMFIGGVVVCDIASIDWEQSEVHWKIKDDCAECLRLGRNHHVTKESHLAPVGRAQSVKESSRLSVDMAEIPEDYQGPSSSVSSPY